MDTKKIETVLTTVTIDSKVDSGKIDVVVGESAKMDVVKAVNYIQSGKAEIEAGVTEVLNQVDNHVTEKTAEFDQNAQDKTDAFNDNASDKTDAFDLNASNKTGDFNTNASNKTTDFNDNYVAKKALIDAEVGIAQTAATNASNSADLSKQWAIGDPTEPSEGSAKYWAEQAAASGGLPDQTGNAGKYLKTDGSDAGWEYTVGTLTNYASNVQYYPGDYVQYYTQGSYHKYICIQPALNKTPPNTNYWLENTRDLPFNVSGGEQPILAYSRTGWSGDTIRSIALYVPGSNTGYGNQPTVNLYSGLMKVPGGIDGYSPDSAFGATAFSNDYDDLDNLPNYGAGLSYNSSSLQLLDQNGNNLGSAVTIKSTPDLDGVTIDTNSNDELEAIGTVNKNTAIGATAVKYDWIGTLAEYNAQNVETLHPEWICYITDDVSGGISVYTKTEVDNAISTALTTMLDSAFPVGSRYITENSTCPLATLIPNSTWVLTSQGRVIQGADSNHLAGTTAEAGLPNITGTAETAPGGDNYAFSGAFSGKETLNRANTYSLSSLKNTGTLYGMQMDASWSNPIYGNSTTVQPPAEFVNIFKRIA